VVATRKWTTYDGVPQAATAMSGDASLHLPSLSCARWRRLATHASSRAAAHVIVLRKAKRVTWRNAISFMTAQP
jgi:hypothetical protein